MAAIKFKPISDTPLVSVVMPAYNAENFIRYAIDSMLQQTHSNIELLIADDMSTDSTRQIIESYDDPRIKTFHNQENMGYLRTCNKLFLQTTGDFITFQDADDGSVPDRLERLLNEFRKDDQLGLCGSQFINMDTENRKYKVDAYRALEHNEIVERMQVCSQFCGATVMVRREVFDDVGIYRTYFDRLGGEDYDWFMMMIEKYKAKNLSDRLYEYRLHDSPVKIGNVDRRKHYTDEIIHFLAAQRKKYDGRDSLSDSEIFGELEEEVERLDKPWREDPTLLLRRWSHTLINNKEYRRSLKTALQAVRDRPYNIQNYRNFLYCLYVISRRKLGV